MTRTTNPNHPTTQGGTGLLRLLVGMFCFAALVTTGDIDIRGAAE